MAYIIIIDMRESNGEILGIRHDEVNLAQYDTESEAEELMSKHPLRVFPYAIIDMGE